jgi:hypothetical protein
MDVFNHPPSIAEDTLQYIIYPSPGASDHNTVTALATVVQQYVDSLLQQHIWHRDGFELKVVKDHEVYDGRKSSVASEESFFLEGRMRVGDCVDDEWCVVWLLREISRRWDVAIRCAMSISHLPI